MVSETVSPPREREREGEGERESVIVVMDANRSKGSVDAVNWALKHVVRPKDKVVVLGVLCELGKKTFCFPFQIGIGTSGIWERLEFSGSEVNPKDLEEEIEKKREHYQSSLQPLYRQCKKNKVNLEVKLAAGFDPKKITIEEAQKSNTRWIVLDSHLKKEKVFICGQVDCNIAVMKGKDVATLITPKAPEGVQNPRRCIRIDTAELIPDQPEKEPDEGLNGLQDDCCQPIPAPQSPCWYPLSWRTGFPRSFMLTELEDMTNKFADENVVLQLEHMSLYQGILQETPVLVQCFSGNDDQFWSILKILSRVRHRNVMNLVGYCCTGSSAFLLFDFPCMGTLEENLRRDDKAENLSWKLRWHIAQEIGGTLRYLHEECADGPIVHLSVCSSHVVFSHGCSAMLCNFMTAKLLEDKTPSDEDSPEENADFEQHEYLSTDIHDYGVFLLELIAGKSVNDFQAQGNDQSLIDWALPLLENDSISRVMDPRIADACDDTLVHPMARAALLCLQNDSGQKLSMSEVLAVVKGDQCWTSKYYHC